MAQWKVLASTFNVTEKTDGKKLANALRKLALPDNPATVEQVIELEKKLAQVESDTGHNEVAMEQLITGLYMLKPADVKLIEGR